jgi:hypothetical protein
LPEKRDIEGRETVYEGNSCSVVNDAPGGGYFLNADAVILREILEIFSLEDLQVPESREK